MKAELITALNTFGYPVFLQGSLDTDEAYPDSFFTFWNFETPEGEFYDDEAHMAVWGFWVYFYSTNPQLVEQKPHESFLNQSAGCRTESRTISQWMFQLIQERSLRFTV